MAKEGVGQDPFEWEKDRVAIELCQLQGLTNPDQLNQKIQDEEVDGKSLLCYDDTMSKQELLQDLGITKFRDKYLIRSTVDELKSLSPGFQKWKVKYDQMTNKTSMPPHENKPSDAPSEGPPTKKRRLALEDIITVPQEAAAVIVGRLPPPSLLSPQTKPTEAPPFDGQEEVVIRSQLDDFRRSGAYLGYAKLEWNDILRLENTSSDQDIEDFHWTAPVPTPRGRRLQVHRAIRNYLRVPNHVDGTNNQSADQEGSFLADSSEDHILPVFGDSDDDCDSETWQEVQDEENEERLRAETALQEFLTDAEVSDIIAQQVKSIEDEWVMMKLPKHRLRANKLWTEARKHGNRGLQVQKALNRASWLRQRIESLCKEIQRDSWKSRAQVMKQCIVLEQSVFDKQYEEWLARLLNNPLEPPKPKLAGLARRALQSKPQKKPSILEDDEEILSSDSEDDLDDFIVEDDPAVLDSHDPDLSPSVANVDQLISDVGMDMATTSEQNGAQLDQLADRVIAPDGVDTTKPPTPLDTPMEAHDQNPSAGSAVDCEIPYSDTVRIGQLGEQYWAGRKDRGRMVIATLSRCRPEIASIIFDLTVDRSPVRLWRTIEERVFRKKEMSGSESELAEQAGYEYVITLFDMFVNCTPRRNDTYDSLPTHVLAQIRKKVSYFRDYLKFMGDIHPHFVNAPSSDPPTDPTPQILPNSPSSPDPDRDDAGELADLDEDLNPNKRKVQKDLRARELRNSDRKRHKAQEERARALRAQLAKASNISQDKSRLIINESKQADQGLIYVNEHIGRSIKDHQILGVRFMWNAIVVDAKVRQGCLLAHTMGLGKTMQVITLLVAIAEAAASEDPSISSQIPDDLKKLPLKTLVLCPAGLIDNWRDEVLRWADTETLGELRKVQASIPPEERVTEIEQWASSGGVLLIGYPLLSKITKDGDEETKARIWDSPDIVIGDEAHIIKNPRAQVHHAAANFKTSARIAMTGSPLANSVDEYHSMIDWVAPNYLGPLTEFKGLYSIPIRDGLKIKDMSEPNAYYLRRKALKALNILKETVAPKIHRMTIASLKDQLPQKKEFVIYLDLTPVQKSAYDAFLGGLLNIPELAGATQNWTTVFGLVNTLRTLLVHPKILLGRLRLITNTKRDQEDVTMPEGVSNAVMPLLNIREIEDLTLSYKITVLLHILDQAKNMGEKVLIFSQSILTLDFLSNLFNRQMRIFLRLDGSTDMGLRHEQVKAFNNQQNQTECYLISTKAGGVGLNLYGANRVVILDFNFNPIQEQQAIGRSYRIGQTRPVSVYWLVIGGTFEAKLQDQAIFKKQLASRVVDQKNPVPHNRKYGEYFQEGQMVEHQSVAAQENQDSILDSILAAGHLRRGISSILSADTFEEEEPEMQLTAEDRQEVAEKVRQNKLRLQGSGRHKNPMKGTQQAAPTAINSSPHKQPPRGQSSAAASSHHMVSATSKAGQASSQVQSPPAIHSAEPAPFPMQMAGQPPVIFGPAPRRTEVPRDVQPDSRPHTMAKQPLGHAEPSQDEALKSPPHPPIPEQRRQAHVPESEQANAQATISSVPTVKTPCDATGPTDQLIQRPQAGDGQTRERTSSTQADAQGVSGSSTDPQILPSGFPSQTRLENREHRSPAPPETTRDTAIASAVGSSSGVQTTVPDTPSQRRLENSQYDLREQLLKHIALPETVRLLENQNPESVVERVIANIGDAFGKKGLQGLPVKDRWSKLAELSINHPKFADSILVEHTTPETLVTLPNNELESQAGAMSSMDGHEAQDLLVIRRKDPDHIRKHLERSLSSPKPEGEGDHVKGDLEALREVFDRRKRKERLPDWASKALERRRTNETTPRRESRVGDTAESPLVID